MFTILLFLFSFNSTNANPTVHCNSTVTIENVQKTKPANKAIMAYAEFQIVHLQQLADLLDGFLSSGHTTGSNIKNYKMASTTLKQGIKDLNVKKGQISKMTIKNSESYIASLVQVHGIGKEYFYKATNIIGLKKNGKKEFTFEGDYNLGPNCLSVGSHMKTACLNGIQKMSDCGVYDVLGLSRMMDDQEKCDGKAAAAMLLCTQSEGEYSGYKDMSDELLKAEMVCEQHVKVVGGGSQLQTQTWDGF